MPCWTPTQYFNVYFNVFVKLVNNRTVDHSEKCGLFSDFKYGFRSSQSTVDLLTAVSDRHLTGTQAVALDLSKPFDWVRHAGIFHKLKSYGIPGQIIGLISSFLSTRGLRMVLDGKSSHEYPVNARVPQGSILGPIHYRPYSCYTLMTFLMMLSMI